MNTNWNKTKRLVVLVIFGLSTMAASCLSFPSKPKPGAPVRGADELFWVPTLEQALAMAQVTGKPIFLMGYSLVGDGSTYTKAGPEFCSGVF